MLYSILILIGAVILLYALTEGRWRSKDFWRKQFALEVTGGQIAFDALLGVVMPVICLVGDPVVFQNRLAYGQSILNSIKPFAYTSIMLGIFALSLWLILSKYLRGTSAFLSGIFFYGALFALLLGIILLPFSFIGSFATVGLLGFTPFFTALVFFRNGVRAYRQANEQIRKKWMLRVSFVLGMILIIVIPLLVQATNLLNLASTN